MVQTQFPDAFWPNSMSMSSVVGGAESGTIGNHSIGAYRQLCAGVGETFEAVSTALENPVLASQLEHIAFVRLLRFVLRSFTNIRKRAQ